MDTPALAPEGLDRVTFEKFSSIKSFSNLTTAVRECFASERKFRPICLAESESIVYQGKVKLHGSNAGIRIEGDKIRAQTRNQLIDRTCHGAIVYAHRDYFLSLFDPTAGYKSINIFGEWAGPGIQKGVALCDLKTQILAIFTVQFDDHIMMEPNDIYSFMTCKGTKALPPNVYILPWHTPKYIVDFRDIPSIDPVLEQIEKEVIKIDNEDPWVLQTFGVKGTGEGLVMFPVSLGVVSKPGLCDCLIPKPEFTTFVFKAKGEKHRVTGTKKSVQLNPEVVSSAKAYCQLMVPEPRLLQGISETGPVNKKNLGKFIQWILNDVKKEGADELAASGLEWSQVASGISEIARVYYLKKVAEGTITTLDKIGGNS